RSKRDWSSDVCSSDLSSRSLADIVPAAEKNPAFANSYDWHSSVHMHYLLASLLGTDAAGTASWRDEAIEVLSSHLSDVNMIAERSEERRGGEGRSAEG